MSPDWPSADRGETIYEVTGIEGKEVGGVLSGVHWMFVGGPSHT